MLHPLPNRGLRVSYPVRVEGVTDVAYAANLGTAPAPLYSCLDTIEMDFCNTTELGIVMISPVVVLRCKKK